MTTRSQDGEARDGASADRDEAIDEQDLALQRYFDGDLDAPEAAAFAARLVPGSQESERLDRLERLGVALGCLADEETKALDSAALFAGVVAGLARPASQPPGLRAIDGGALDLPSRPPGGRGVERTRRLFGISVGVLGLAAAALLGVIAAGRGAGVPWLSASAKHDGPVLETRPTVIVDAPSGSEVIAVDFGESAGTIFAVEGEKGQSLAVVWITDEGKHP